MGTKDDTSNRVRDHGGVYRLCDIVVGYQELEAVACRTNPRFSMSGDQTRGKICLDVSTSISEFS